MIWLQLSAMSMVLTAIAHSLVGEKRLIGPLLACNLELLSGYRPKLVRFAWHFTSVLMLLNAAVVAWPQVPVPLVVATGAIWLLAGAIDAIYTRGRHIGWPFLSAAGALALIGVL